ncbi:hypothetical protein BC832DRAFT_590233 [Gaertneriomyces semiglobifer]|nr:hypothetical protein BC832DRAFT_590233 [Gaertneriomyces semiglobifer]
MVGKDVTYEDPSLSIASGTCAEPTCSHFIATSNAMFPLQFVKEVIDDIVRGLETGIVEYDAVKRQDILAVGGLFLIECDKPMANELGAVVYVKAGKRFCRFCKVKRVSAKKADRDNETIAAVFCKSDLPRPQIHAASQTQNPRCTKQDVQMHIDSETSVERHVINPVFPLNYGFDGHQHISVEILQRCRWVLSNT